MTLTAKDIEHLRPMVEKAAEAEYIKLTQRSSAPTWAWAADNTRRLYIADMEAGILAFLNACLEGGVARVAQECTGCGCRLSIEELQRKNPTAFSCCPERDMQPTVILNLGEAK
jgi:hypothetical protein